MQLLFKSTLKVYKNGEEKEYGGTRQADGIISYMFKSVSTLYLLGVAYPLTDSLFLPCLRLPPPTMLNSKVQTS